jgi:hypothetical protein
LVRTGVAAAIRTIPGDIVDEAADASKAVAGEFEGGSDAPGALRGTVEVLDDDAVVARRAAPGLLDSGTVNGFGVGERQLLLL